MALPTSGTYNFQSIKVETLIVEAYERVGYPRHMLEPEKLISALRSLNLIFLDWMNKGVNLWTLATDYLTLNPFQNSYKLPIYVSDMTQINTRQFTRRVGSGTPATTGGGIAANAFDGNFATACVNNITNGVISYNFAEAPVAGITPSQQVISFVGIRSNVNATYQIDVRARVNVGDPSTILLSIPSQQYEAGVTKWFDIPTPISAFYYDIVETTGAGATPLNIQEVYFGDQTLDIQMSNVSRNEYFSYPSKGTPSRPSTYYVDRQSTGPILNLYPVADSSFPCLQYSYQRMMQDAVRYTDSIEIPSRFYPAAIAALAKALAIKAEGLGMAVTPDKVMMLQSDAETTFMSASREDSESTPMGFELDMSSYI